MSPTVPPISTMITSGLSLSATLRTASLISFVMWGMT